MCVGYVKGTSKIYISEGYEERLHGYASVLGLSQLLGQKKEAFLLTLRRYISGDLSNYYKKLHEK